MLSAVVFIILGNIHGHKKTSMLVNSAKEAKMLGGVCVMVKNVQC